MKIAFTGVNGYIGSALTKRGAIPLCADITKPGELEVEFKEKKPDVILHLAAKSDPDWCEQEENKNILSETNVRGTYNVFYRACELKIPCVLLSTGQVWKGGFWEREHREYDRPNSPVNQYGLSKLAAEYIVRRLFANDGGRIIRTSFVFGRERLATKFYKWERGETVFEPTFIKRSFIYIDDFAELLMEYCERVDVMPEILHLAGNETCSWYDFLFEVAKEYGYTDLVKPRKYEVTGLAPRSRNAGLSTELARSLGFRIPNFIEGIKRMKNEI